MKHPPSPPPARRIVLTGGPGGGKTTAADLFRREIGERVVIVPEAATILFQGGFPRSLDPDAARLAQSAIFHVQRKLEDVQATLFPGRTLICDRGTVDGAAYWPDGESHYFTTVGSTLEKEFERYAGVLFFETAAAGGISIEGGNPIRNETIEQARRIDLRLRQLWERHPGFIFIPHQPSFFRKIGNAFAALERLVRNEEPTVPLPER